MVHPSSLLPPPSPQCLLGSSPPAAASGEKQPPFFFLPPFFRPCLCQVPPLSQASEQPWRQEGHVKSFFPVLRRHEGGGVRIVVGGLAPSHHCFNPSSTGGSFSPFLSTQSLFPPLSSSLVMKCIYWRRKQLLLLLLLLGLAPLFLLHDLSPAREGRAGCTGAGPWGPRTSRAPSLSRVPAAHHSLSPCAPSPSLPLCPACQPRPCSVETHKPYCPLGAGAEPFVAPLPGE